MVREVDDLTTERRDGMRRLRGAAHDDFRPFEAFGLTYIGP